MHDFNPFNLRFDLRCRRADRVDALHALAQQIVEQGVVAALVLAPKNEVDVCRKRLQRLDRCIHIRGLGVVVVIHAANRRHMFQPMLHRLELAHGLPNFLCSTSHQRTRANRRQHVLQIVRTLQRNL